MDLLIAPLAALVLLVLGGTLAATVLAWLAPSTAAITLWCAWLALAGSLTVFVLDALIVSRAPLMYTVPWRMRRVMYCGSCGCTCCS